MMKERQQARMEAVKAMREHHKQRLRELMDAARQTEDPAKMDELIEAHMQEMMEQARKFREAHRAARPAMRGMRGAPRGMMSPGQGPDEGQTMQMPGPRWGGPYGGMPAEQMPEDFQPGQGPRWGGPYGGMPAAPMMEDVPPAMPPMPSREDMIEMHIKRMEAMLEELRSMKQDTSGGAE
jgi:hypothetical protein